ncbi:unnamed protein product, partial [Sphacelaria rigidula]
ENWGGLARGDVIRPMSAVLKLTHNDDPADTIGPEFEASLEVDDIRVDLRAEQYEQILQLKDNFVALANWQIFFPYRPKASPLQDPRAWWRYAYVCVKGKPGAVSKLVKIIAARKKYVSLFERVAAASWESEHSSPPSFEAIGLLRPLEDEERSELDAMEESLPAEAILMFRTMARRNLKRLRDEAERAGQYTKVEERTDGNTCNEHKKNKQKKKKQQGWFGWWGNLTRDDKAKQDGDVSIDDLGAFIAEKDKPKEVPPDYVQIRAAARCCGA